MAEAEGDTWRILIPTRDSARWIGAFAAHYRRQGLHPLFVYDARSRDDTLAILRAQGFEPLIYQGGGADIVEGGIMEFGARASAATWILRMDDDEYPSQRLIAFASGLGADTQAGAYFVSRRELMRDGAALVYSRHRYRYFCHGFGATLNPQLRLFRPASARFGRRLHSPGLEIDASTALAPDEAFYAHLTFLLRSPAERLEKVRAYDALDPGLGWLYADEYWPELLPPAAHRARGDGLAQFARLVEDLPPPAPAPPPALSEVETERFSAALARKWRLYFEERGGDGGDMAQCAGAPAGGFGWTPPATLVVAPSRLLGLAAQFGEFDFVARENFGGWLAATAKAEQELAFVWGDASQEELVESLREIARRPLPLATEAELLQSENGGVVRIGAAARPLRKRLAAILSLLPRKLAGFALTRVFFRPDRASANPHPDPEPQAFVGPRAQR